MATLGSRWHDDVLTLVVAWPELQILAVVRDGTSAVAQALRLRPDVLFFDIRMSGLSGLADDWGSSGPTAKIASKVQSALASHT